MKKQLFKTMAVCAVLAGFAQADVLVSVTNNATLGGLSFSRGDVVRYDAGTDTATLFFDSNLFDNSNEQIDALHVLSNGNLLLSTSNNATLAGLSFSDGDLVEYDFGTGTASLFFDEDLFSGNENIDAAAVLGNGNLVLSTTNNASLGGLSFSDGDLAEYNAGSDTASLFFNEDLFSGNEDIDAVAILANGNLVLSTQNNATLGGLSFSDGDLVEYDPVNDVATLLFDEDLFSGNEDIDGVSAITTLPNTIPAPGAAILAAIGLPIAGWVRRRR